MQFVPLSNSYIFNNNNNNFGLAKCIAKWDSGFTCRIILDHVPCCTVFWWKGLSIMPHTRLSSLRIPLFILHFSSALRNVSSSLSSFKLPFELFHHSYQISVELDWFIPNSIHQLPATSTGSLWDLCDQHFDWNIVSHTSPSTIHQEKWVWS